ncbi:hypothetical protein D3C77_450460 [compost metagenome]
MLYIIHIGRYIVYKEEAYGGNPSYSCAKFKGHSRKGEVKPGEGFSAKRRKQDDDRTNRARRIKPDPYDHLENRGWTEGFFYSARPTVPAGDGSRYTK